MQEFYPVIRMFGVEPSNNAFADLIALQNFSVDAALDSMTRVMFQWYDQDKDGAISDVELRQMVQDIETYHHKQQLSDAAVQARCAHLMQRIDLNKSGAVECDEFKIAIVKNVFDL